MNLRATIKSVAVATLILGAPTAAYANTQNFSGHNAQAICCYRLPSNSDNDFTLTNSTGQARTDVYNCGNGGTYRARLWHDRTLYPDELEVTHTGSWCNGAWQGTATWVSGKHHWDIFYPQGVSSNVSGFLKVPA